jgi:TatA/E family protein of Tat protein translocase
LKSSLPDARGIHVRRTFPTDASAGHLGIALLVFGPKKLPELGKGLGEGMLGFKAAMDPRKEAKPPATLTVARVERVRRGRHEPVRRDG